MTRRARTASISALLACLLCAGTAQGASLVGTWTLVVLTGSRGPSTPVVPTEFVFTKDGDASTRIRTGKPTRWVTIFKGTWRIDGTSLVLTETPFRGRQSPPRREVYVLKGATLAYGPSAGRLHFARKGTKPPPALKKLIRKALAEEAKQAVDKIAAGAKAYFIADHYDRAGNLLPKRFPPGKAGWTPRTPCCRYSGRICPARPKYWNAVLWRSLKFQSSKPHGFQVRYRSDGANTKATFSAELRADLDCDGTYSSYQLVGRVNAQLKVKLERKVLRPLE